MKKIVKHGLVFLALCYFGFSCFHKTSTLDVEKDLPKLDTKVTAPTTMVKASPVVQLFRDGVFYCTGFVIGHNYIVTAGHCVADDSGHKRTHDEIEIRISNKKVTTGKAVGADFRRDLGLIQGDFSKFDMIEMENEHPGFQAGEPILTCGYAGGNKNWTCTTFQPAINDSFLLKGFGILIPGMSGGPAINIITNKAMGVNVCAYGIEEQGGVGISFTYGILGLFGIEP